MKKLIFVILICLMGLSGCSTKIIYLCLPNLIVKNVYIDYSTDYVYVSVMNTGNADAENHLTYIEINNINANTSQKPQSQYSANISSIAVGESWEVKIEFKDFSAPNRFDLSALTSANVVVKADAKNMVKESNENDNYYNEIL